MAGLFIAEKSALAGRWRHTSHRRLSAQANLRDSAS
jgi:hypothetical protein